MFTIVVDTISTDNTQNAGQVTLNKPANVVDGDLMIAQIVLSDNACVCTPPAGWTKIQDGAPASGLPYMASFYKKASGEGASYIFTWTSGPVRCVASIVRITGAQIVDTSSEQYTDVLSTTATGGTVTPNYANCTLLFLVGAGIGAIGSYAIVTSNPSWAELYDLGNTSIQGAMAWGSRPQVTATGNATASCASSRSAVHIIVLKEAPVVTITESVTLTESELLNMDCKVTETVALTEVVTTTIGMWAKITKTVSTWLNGTKH